MGPPLYPPTIWNRQSAVVSLMMPVLLLFGKLSHHLTPSAITGKLVARLLAMGDFDDARIAISDALSKKEATDRPSSSATRGTKAAKYETGKTIQPQAGNVQSGNSTVLC